MLISTNNPATDSDTARQRIRDARDQALNPMPIPKPEQKYDIQPQPIEQPRPTPIPEPDRVTLSLPTQAREGLNLTYRPDGTLPDSKIEQQDYLAQIMQAMTDAKVGFNREKYEELQENIDAILSLEEPTEAELAQLEALEQQQQQLIKAGADRMAEHAINTEKV